MLHTQRVWTLTVVGPSQLAHRLKNHSWCLCTGFRCEGLLWLNDSTSEDAIQEYAVVRTSDRIQLDSVTVGWCDKENIEKYQHEFSAPDAVPLMGWKLKDDSIDCSEEHRCARCA